MATLEFYRRLDYDFSIYEGEESLRGLIHEGFIGTESLCINEFNYLELNAARDVILCYLRPVAKINKNENSYSLKHIVEHILAKETNGVINYISNGTFILAMYSCGFRIWRTKSDKNCFFNVSDKSIRYLLFHKGYIVIRPIHSYEFPSILHSPDVML